MPGTCTIQNTALLSGFMLGTRREKASSVAAVWNSSVSLFPRLRIPLTFRVSKTIMEEITPPLFTASVASL